MRIQVVTSLYPSPVRPREGIFAERRWRAMRERGHAVTIVHPQPRALPFLGGKHAEFRRMPEREERGGLLVLRPRYLHWPRAARGNARRFAARALTCLAPETEVVVCDYAWPASALAPALRARGVACVVCGRGSDVLEVGGEAGLAAELGRYLRAAGSWIAVSADLVAAMDRLAGAPGVGRLVPNGVDTELFHPRARAEARAALGLPSAAPLVLVVGHLIERKDPLLALEVFAAGAPPRAELRFIGRGPLASALEQRIRELGLAERVRVLGERPPEELALWYGACELVLLTSRREGRPNVVLEALASGRPVLATRVGGTAEILSDPDCLAPAGERAELARKLGLLLARTHEAEALARGVEPLSWSASLDLLEQALQLARERARAA